MIEDLLKLRGSRVTLLQGEIRHPAGVDRIHRAEAVVERDSRDRKIMWGSNLQHFDCLSSIISIERKLCSQRRQIVEPHRRVFWEAFFQIV